MAMRPLRPNGCAMDTSHWSETNQRTYMEDRIVIDALGSLPPQLVGGGGSCGGYSDTLGEFVATVRDTATNWNYSGCDDEKGGLWNKVYTAANGLLPSRAGGCEGGSSSRMEDDLYVKMSIYAVFDGHAGSLASQYCCDWISSYLKSDPSFPHDMTSALRNSFTALDEDFLSTTATKPSTGSNRHPNHPDGTTACACVILGGQRILCANAGDSRAIVVKSTGASVALSTDHKPNSPTETKRINDLGGKVIFSGQSWRLEGRLAVSRGIGDVALKRFMTSEPDVCDYTICSEEGDVDGEDWFVVIASDGLWDVLENDQVARMTLAYSCRRTQGDDGGLETDLESLRWTARKLCENAQ